MRYLGPQDADEPRRYGGPAGGQEGGPATRNPARQTREDEEWPNVQIDREREREITWIAGFDKKRRRWVIHYSSRQKKTRKNVNRWLTCWRILRHFCSYPMAKYCCCFVTHNLTKKSILCCVFFRWTRRTRSLLYSTVRPSSRLTAGAPSH